MLTLGTDTYTAEEEEAAAADAHSLWGEMLGNVLEEPETKAGVAAEGELALQRAAEEAAATLGRANRKHKDLDATLQALCARQATQPGTLDALARLGDGHAPAAALVLCTRLQRRGARCPTTLASLHQVAMALQAGGEHALARPLLEAAEAGPVQPTKPSCSLQRALLTPNDNPGSRYRCGKST